MTKFSLTANAILVAIVIWVRQPVRVVEDASSTIATVRNSAPAQPALDMQLTAGQPAPPAKATFRWSELESTDYRTYIANLRGIGCPEQTIRDIITADVDGALYAVHRQQLEEAALATGTLSFDSAGRRLAATELKRLQSAEGALVTALLAPPGDGTRATSLAPLARNNPFQNTRARMPLALQVLDSTARNFSAEELQFAEAVRESFMQDIGGSNQDPNDPAYRQRWEIAQRNADYSLRGMLGRRRYLELQEQARVASQTLNQ